MSKDRVSSALEDARSYHDDLSSELDDVETSIDEIESAARSLRTTLAKARELWQRVLDEIGDAQVETDDILEEGGR
jgi:chromosome segregation ATPase